MILNINKKSCEDENTILHEYDEYINKRNSVIFLTRKIVLKDTNNERMFKTNSPTDTMYRYTDNDTINESQNKYHNDSKEIRYYTPSHVKKN